MTISQALALPRLHIRERRKLLRAILGFSEVDLFLRAERPLSPAEMARYEDGLSRREQGEPMAYIIGYAEFYQRDFLVTPAVLIPRPETEMLVRAACELQPQRVLEIGCGSGCLAISVQKELGVPVVAADISPAALAVAQQNAERHDANIELIESDLFSAVTGQYDLILSNPPYIDSQSLLDLEVAEYEPHLALDGGPQGLHYYQQIIPQARDYLEPGGHLLLEIGYDQAEAILKLLEASGYCDMKITQDLSGFDRMVQACYRSEK